MLGLYHGGNFDALTASTLWTTPDVDYAAGYAELHDSAVVWALILCPRRQ